MSDREPSEDGNTSPPAAVHAFFRFHCPPHPEAFVFELRDADRIAHARAILAGEVTDRVHVHGVIVKEERDYNFPWSFHLDPDSVQFFEFAAEVCDAAIRYVEEHLDDVGGALLPGNGWCPWGSELLEEVDPAVLPSPMPWMTPRENGKLLLLYVSAGKPVARLDFSGASLMTRPLVEAGIAPDISTFDVAANLATANLSGVILRRSNLRECVLPLCDLSGADLGGADLTGADLSNSKLECADLREATFDGANMNQAALRGARLEGASLVGVMADGVDWTDARLEGADVTDIHVDQEALASHPQLRRLVLGDGPGLTLTFDTRLQRFDPTAFDAFIAGVLGRDTDVTIEARSNVREEGPGWIRINGSEFNDLVLVAEAFYDRTWRKAEDDAAREDQVLARVMKGLELMFGSRLDELRDVLSRVEANTGVLANDDVREAITDKSQEHANAKWKKTHQTRLRRVAEGLLLEAPKALASKYLGDSVGEVAGEVVGELVGDAIGAGAKAAADVLADEAKADVKGLLEGTGPGPDDDV